MQNAEMKILIIEGSLAEAKLLKGMLAEALKPQVLEHVEHLAAALDLLKNRDFDCVLVDLELPDSQGLEIPLALRSRAKRTPIVVLTAPDDEDLARSLLEMDIQDYLVKGAISNALLNRSILHAIQRKRISDRLWESEQRFAAFMLNMPMAAWMKDMQGRYVYANAEAERIFSSPLAELQGKRDEELFPPDTARQFRANDERVIAEGGSLQTTEVLRQADGRDHHSIVHKFAVHDPEGEPAYLAGVALDITEHKRSEQALRKAEQKLRNVVENSTNLFYMHGTDQVLTYMSPQSRQFFDCEPDDVKGRWTELITDNPANLLAIEATQRAIDTGERQPPYQVECIGRKGRKVWAEVHEVPVLEDGKTVAIVGSLTDITERKQAEEKIDQLYTDLAARAAELALANQDLEAFNYTVAHDLRKPLSVVNCYCQALKELCGDQLDAHCQEYLQEAYNGTWRMNRLIDALLDFSRLAHLELRREKVDLSQLAHELAEELKVAEPGRRVDFRIGEEIAVDGDRDLLRVALENLLGNAWKYSAGREEAVIEFGAKEIDGKQTFFVRDNGPGFDMADAEKIFTPFQRLPGAEESRGHGIGLATVERIIRRHGGRVWAEGEPGKGAIFYFTLSAVAGGLG